MRFYNAIIEIGLIFLIIFTPLALGTVHVWAYTIMELTVLLLVTVWLLKMIHQGEISIPRTPLNIPVMLFLLLIIFQLISLPEGMLKTLSPNTFKVYLETVDAINSTNHTLNTMNTLSLYPYATKTELLKLLAYIGVFFLIVGNATTTKQTDRLIKVIIFAGFFISLFGLIQHFAWNGKIFWFKEFTRGAHPFASFINKNNFAGYINLIIPIALSMFMAQKDHDKKYLFGFMAVVMASALFLSLSRGGILAFGGAAASMSILLLFTRYKGIDKKSIPILGGFLVCVLLYLIYLGIDPVIDRFATLADNEADLLKGRREVWRATTDIIKDYSLTGTGYDTFEAVFPGYQPLRVSNLRWLDAHNDYIQFVSETGIAGLLIALSFFIIFFQKAFYSLFRSNFIDNNLISNIGHRTSSDYLLIGLLWSVIAFLLSINFTFNIRIPADALLFAVVLALCVRISLGKIKERGV